MDIEGRRNTPERSSRSIDPSWGDLCRRYQARELAASPRPHRRAPGHPGAKTVPALCSSSWDSTLAARINPLMVTKHGAGRRPRRQGRPSTTTLFRHPDIWWPCATSTRNPMEDRASVRPVSYGARRQHRLHGQRRRPGHGDDGHHQATTAAAGQLPRRRRRRQPRKVTAPSRSSPPTA